MVDEVKTTLEVIRLQWNNLEEMVEQGSASPTDTSPVTLQIASGALLGIDRRSRLHLILALREGEDGIRTRLTSGISITSQRFEIGGSEMEAIDIIAEKRWRFAIEPFSAEVIMRMSKGTIDLQTLREIVDEHRSLWESPREPLSPTEQRGLVGELQVVMRLGEVLSAASVVTRWRGPERGIHDIADEESAIEVKTYADEPPRVRIHHIEQLDYRMDKRLTVVGVHLISSNEGKTLPEYVDEAILWSDENGCRPHLEEQLKVAKWRDEDRSEYYSRFIVGRKIICPIRPETPVFPPHLRNHIPSSVSNITYALHLNDLEHLPPDSDESWRVLLSPGQWQPDPQDMSPDMLVNSECSEILASDSQTLVNRPESQHLEFKSSTWHAYQDSEIPPEVMMKKLEAEVIEGIAGLLNSEGGCLIIGVDDDGKSLGLSNDLQTRGLSDLDHYENTIVQLLSQRVGKSTIASCVRIYFEELDGSGICRINVKPSTKPVFYKEKGKAEETFFVRINNATHRLSSSQILEYYSEHWLKMGSNQEAD